MCELEEIAECLLDSDGTTRDITFTPVAANGVRNFINSLRTVYRVTKASDTDGNGGAPNYEAI
ncbi:MAG: hypothetical protein JSU95_15155 [Betaproteobacteria bacterium]|nr:MAG: hypothetical protein JSU95_15155 [Betaproteobacteria bacterium]